MIGSVNGLCIHLVLRVATTVFKVDVYLFYSCLLVVFLLLLLLLLPRLFLLLFRFLLVVLVYFVQDIVLYYVVICSYFVHILIQHFLYCLSCFFYCLYIVFALWKPLLFFMLFCYDFTFWEYTTQDNSPSMQFYGFYFAFSLLISYFICDIRWSLGMNMVLSIFWN